MTALKDGYRGKISLRQSEENRNYSREEDIANFLETYPDCCKVYRKSSGHIKVYHTLWDRAFLRLQTVVVKVRDIESINAVREGKPAIHEDVFIVVSMCGQYLNGY